jgi:hypothetical protein
MPGEIQKESNEMDNEIKQEEDPVMHRMVFYDWDDPFMVQIRECCDYLENYFTFADYDLLSNKFRTLQNEGPVLLDQLIENDDIKYALRILAEKNEVDSYGCNLDYKIGYLSRFYGVELKYHKNNHESYWEVCDIYAE